MANSTALVGSVTAILAAAAALQAQMPKPDTLSAYACYVQSAESRMAARTTFLLVDGEPASLRGLVRDRRILTTPGNPANPQKITGGMIFDWIGTVFIPGASVERTVRMLQDYDHRADYFPDVIASSRLFCAVGSSRFGFRMRIKEPVVADSDNDVFWEQVDARHWRCRSYSGDVQEVGKPKGYLHRLNSYWRFAETNDGVFVEGETVTLSNEFGSVMRALGSLAGVSPEKSLRRTLLSLRDTVLSKREFAPPAAGLPACAEPTRPSVCKTESLP
jgi:hypothetical protein